jgi:glycosyltransferase involved in cell wall biosynthesis
VIAFDVGGVAEMVEHGVTGELVSFESAGSGQEGGAPRSVELLAGALLRYVRDAELRARQGARGRLRIEHDFDARAHGRRIQEEILGASGLR